MVSTNIRPQVSPKNRYWIPKHRYYELKHFCMQYPDWKKAYNSLDGMPTMAPAAHMRKEEGAPVTDSTATYAEARLYYRGRMDMVEEAAKKATGGEDLGSYPGCFWKTLLNAIVEGKSYEIVMASNWIPCSKDEWYVMYRRFFWLLDFVRR